MLKRCPWAENSPLEIEYHDRDWGVPLHDDRQLFELMILEGAQAGLSWATILKKRSHYQKVFDGFDAKKIAHYDDRKIAQLLADPGIVRNRLKIAATITNAQAYLQLQKELSLDALLWSFVEGRAKQNRRKSMQDVPAKTTESDAMSKELKRRGFKFVGSTICYALMQAAGLVNDHLGDCFRCKEVQKK